MLLLIRLLHPHTQRRRHQRLFLDNSESINMKQTNRTETFETLVNYNKGICPDINSQLNMKTVLQVTSVPIRSLFVFSIQLLPVFTCCLQSVCRASLSIPTSLLRYFLGDSKARTPTSSLLTHTELDYNNYLSFSFDG